MEASRILVKILLMACVGGTIGYITNVLAVKMLFKPIEPINVPFTNLEIIGLIPKRRKEISSSIGKTVGERLIDYDELIASMLKEEDKEELKVLIKKRLAVVVDEKANFIPFLFRGKVIEFVEEVVDSEFDSSIDTLIASAKEKAISRIDVGKMIETKINELDLLELENIIISISKRELKHIENLGFLLGFIIGIAQGVISILI